MFNVKPDSKTERAQRENVQEELMFFLETKRPARKQSNDSHPALRLEAKKASPQAGSLAPVRKNPQGLRTVHNEQADS